MFRNIKFAIQHQLFVLKTGFILTGGYGRSFHFQLFYGERDPRENYSGFKI